MSRPAHVVRVSRVTLRVLPTPEWPFLSGVLVLASRVRAVAHLPLLILFESSLYFCRLCPELLPVMDAQDAKQQDAMRKLEEYIEKCVRP